MFIKHEQLMATTPLVSSNEHYTIEFIKVKRGFIINVYENKFYRINKQIIKQIINLTPFI